MTKETNGKRFNRYTQREEVIYCPTDALDCPYNHNGICYIKTPADECDDFMSYYPTWEDWEER